MEEGETGGCGEGGTSGDAVTWDMLSVNAALCRRPVKEKE